MLVIATVKKMMMTMSPKRIMTDALEDHEGTVSIGGRTTTNLRFADDIDGLAGEEEELANLVEPTAWRSVPRRPS